MSKKTIVLAILLTSFSLGIGSITISHLVPNNIVVTSACPCDGHVGYHYAKKDPTKTESGHKEFWTCCKCHQQFLEEQEGAFYDVDDSAMTGGLSEEHIAYLAPLGEPVIHHFENGVCTECHKTIVSLANDNYASSLFNNYINGDRYLSFYEELKNKCTDIYYNFAGEIENQIIVDYLKYGISTKEAINISARFNCDYPIFYFLDNTLNFDYQYVYFQVNESCLTGSSRDDYCNKIDVFVNNYSSRLTNGSDYEYVISAHDIVNLSVDYDNDDIGQKPHSILGVIDGTGAVCEGYSKTFELLLDIYDIPSIIVTGSAGDEAHAWNLVNVDDNWYWADLTWDDGDNYDYMTDHLLYYFDSFYRYFLKDDATILNYKGESFLEKHTCNDSVMKDEVSSTNTFMYDLPNRALSCYEPSYTNIGLCFEKDGFEYRIITHDCVALTFINKVGDVTIPECVDYNEVSYYVLSIGREVKSIYSYLDVGVLNENVSSIIIPKYVRYIWPHSLTCSMEQYQEYDGSYNVFYENNYLLSIGVNENNIYYRSLDGVLFTKGLETLIAYPCGSASTIYEIPSSTIALGSQPFGYEAKLDKLVFGKNMHYIGVSFYGTFGGVGWTPWTTGSVTQAPYMLYSYAKSFEVDEDCDGFACDDSFVYDLGRATYDFAPTADIICYSNVNSESLTIPATVTHLGEEWEIRFLEGINYYRPGNSILDQMKNLKDIKSNNSLFDVRDGILYWDEANAHRISYDRDEIRAIYIFSNEPTVSLHDGMKKIDLSMFYENDILVSITMPKSITRVDSFAFYGCTNLKNIYYEGTMEEWGMISFGDLWNDRTGDYVIHCSNGDIPKQSS